MKWPKRVVLFIAVNILVIATISIVTSLLGIQPYLNSKGIDYGSLMLFCLIWGFGGAFISLGISRMMAKWSMGVKVIDPKTAGGDAAWLVKTVHRLASDAQLKGMPEVGIYDSPEINAFATGPSERRSLVAVSTGLLRQMNEKEIEGVLAHEVAHIANGDMVSMTLVQGIVNAFVMFFARVIAFSLAQFVREESRAMVQFIATIVLDIALSFLAMFVVAWFSRRREFRADAGGAALTDRSTMIAALQRLQHQPAYAAASNEAAYETLKISNRSGLMAWLSTHPRLEDRIARLSAQT